MVHGAHLYEKTIICNAKNDALTHLTYLITNLLRPVFFYKWVILTNKLHWMIGSNSVQKIGISDRNVHVDENNDASGIFQAATGSLVFTISFCFYECQQRNGKYD